MKIAPRYDTEPIVTLDGPPSAVRGPFLRQRQRFAKALAELSPEQWAVQSRCAGWRVQDVVAHLTTTDQFWNVSIQSGLAGVPTRILAEFDPRATPAALVDAVRGATPDETFAAYLEANQALRTTIESLDEQGWAALAEAPVGHVTVSAIAHHALWDSWVHERDVLEPLGIAQDEEPDEIVASLRYAAVLGPAFAVQSSTRHRGSLALDVTRPDLRVIVTVDDDVSVTECDAPNGDLVLTGDAIEVLEALSVRAAWRQPLPAETAWLVTGLSEVFESTVPS
jgi:uncharacterized protein (TIGR03083 family)